MNNARIEYIIASLFTQFADWQDGIAIFDGVSVRDRWSAKSAVAVQDIGMYFCFNISVHNHGYEKDGSTHHADWEREFYRSIHVIILSGRRVYVAVTEQRGSVRDVDPALFENTSNHDSCWRTDGLRKVWATLNEGYEFCYRHVPDEHRKPPGLASIFNTFGQGVFNGNTVHFVKVERAPLEGDNYFDKLTAIKPLKMQVSLTEE